MFEYQLYQNGTGFIGGKFQNKDEAIGFARKYYGIETLYVYDPEPRRDPNENITWHVYNEANQPQDEHPFIDDEVYIIERLSPALRP